LKGKRDTDVRIFGAWINNHNNTHENVICRQRNHKVRQQSYNALQDLFEQHHFLGIIGRELTQTFGEYNKGFAPFFCGNIYIQYHLVVVVLWMPRNIIFNRTRSKRILKEIQTIFDDRVKAMNNVKQLLMSVTRISMENLILILINA
jgi:hypothetical protein